MRSKHRLGLALFAVALVLIGGKGPLTTDEAPVPRPICEGPPDPAGLIGTDWTDEDKAGWVRDQDAAMQRCRDDRLVHQRALGF